MISNKKSQTEDNKENCQENNDADEMVTESENEEICPDKEIDIDAVLAENQKLKNDFLRAYADAENTKKRCHLEMEKSVKFAIADFAKSLLSVADNLQRALDACNNDDNNDAVNGLCKGIELTQSELFKVFDKFGIHKMDIVGKVFDPNFHRVVQEVEDKTQKAGTIVSEVQTGYMIHDRILREAMVIVTK